METSKPIDMMTMIDEGKQKRTELLNKTCLFIRLAINEGRDKKEIAENIKSLALPIDMHLAIFAHFSEICRHGKILTKNERMILR